MKKRYIKYSPQIIIEINKNLNGDFYNHMNILGSKFYEELIINQ
tara:strand:- start:1440 stop:1571 length:132 start_codon:yes stop_codon:yes gene_type:complete